MYKETNSGKSRDMSQIRGVVEQQFYLLLTRKLPDAEILYESHEFELNGEDGKIETTIPDFYIKKPNGSEIFVEITAATWSSENDPKEKQKRIMEQAVPPNAKYVVLYRHNLLNVEAKHPEISFFGSRKILSNNDDQLLFP